MSDMSRTTSDHENRGGIWPTLSRTRNKLGQPKNEFQQSSRQMECLVFSLAWVSNEKTLLYLFHECMEHV